MFIAIRRILGLFLSIAVISACSPAQPRVSKNQERSFREIISVNEMNSLLQVKIQSNPEALPEFGHNISITINNLSGDDILLPGNFGVRMFMLKSEDWLEIENGNQYYGEDFVLHSAGHDGFTGHLKTRIRPVLPTQFQSEKNPQALRIVVIGELMAKGIKAGRYTAAYIDIFVSP